MANITGTNGNDILTGTDDNDLIQGSGGDDRIIGSKGFDTLYGLSNSIRPFQPVEDTVDYSNIGSAVNLLTNIQGGQSGSINVALKVDKGTLGTDSIYQFAQIIGAKNKKNTIDATGGGNRNSSSGGLSLNVNLANNSLRTEVNGRNARATQFKVVNFVNVIGSMNNDTIVGSNKGGTLTGGGGNDTITGGTGKDTITGTDSTARGVGEVDTLTGGGGRDKFVLGDKNGAYYVGNGANDYALITDFNLFQDSISIGSLKDYSFSIEGTNTINLYSGKDVNTRDLIAKIQIAGGISSVASNAKSAMSPDASLNAIVGKLDIVSAV